MAIDLHREVHLPKRTATHGQMPSKTDMNFLEAAGTGTHHGVGARIAVVAVIVAVLLAVSVGVPLYQVSQKQAELADQQATQASLEQAIQGYDDVKQEYDSYQNLSNAAGIDGLGVLDLVQDHIMGRCTVVNMSLKDTELTVRVTDVTLAQAGEIAQDLESVDGVGQASVSLAQGAASTDASSTVIDITVELEQEQAAQPASSAADAYGSTSVSQGGSN
jgi:type II secretory pathway pseudopilin PulG